MDQKPSPCCPAAFGQEDHFNENLHLVEPLLQVDQLLFKFKFFDSFIAEAKVSTLHCAKWCEHVHFLWYCHCLVTLERYQLTSVDKPDTLHITKHFKY